VRFRLLRSVVGQRDVVGVFRGAAGLRHGVDGRSGGSHLDGAGAAAEHAAERGSELATHGAVDDEVERVAEHDHHVGEERRQLVGAVVDEREVERLVEDEHDEENGQRQFDDQEDADHRHQHQRCPVALGQATGLAASVLLQQQLAAMLGATHGVDEQHRQYDECRARHEMDKDDAEPVVDIEVDVTVFEDDRHETDLAPRHRLRTQR